MERAGRLAKTHEYPLLVASGIRKKSTWWNNRHIEGKKDNKYYAMLHQALVPQLRFKQNLVYNNHWMTWNCVWMSAPEGPLQSLVGSCLRHFRCRHSFACTFCHVSAHHKRRHKLQVLNSLSAPASVINPSHLIFLPWLCFPLLLGQRMAELLSHWIAGFIQTQPTVITVTCKQCHVLSESCAFVSEAQLVNIQNNLCLSNLLIKMCVILIW